MVKRGIDQVIGGTKQRAASIPVTIKEIELVTASHEFQTQATDLPAAPPTKKRKQNGGGLSQHFAIKARANSCPASINTTPVTKPNAGQSSSKDADTILMPPPLVPASKMAAPKTTSKGKGPVSQVPAKRLSKTVLQKVNQVSQFINGTSDSVLERQLDDQNHVIVPGSAILMAVKAMREDYDIEDPRFGAVEEVEDVILSRYEAKYASSESTFALCVVDVGRKSNFEEGIQQKLEGQELEDVNLLEIELELAVRSSEEWAADRLNSVLEGVLEEDSDEDSEEE